MSYTQKVSAAPGFKRPIAIWFPGIHFDVVSKYKALMVEDSCGASYGFSEAFLLC